jgi:hypothetical protein
VHGFSDYERLDLKIEGREDEVENITVTNRKYYVIDRKLPQNEQGEYLPLKIWLVASREIIKTVAGKTYKTGVDYLASDLKTVTPRNFPQPQNSIFNDGKVYCKLWILEPDLQSRFYGMRIDDKDFKAAVDDYGNCLINIGQNKKPARMAALFRSIDKPVYKQHSPYVEVKSTTTNLRALYQVDSLDDPVSYLAAEVKADSSDIFGLQFLEEKNTNSITLTWNKIPEADCYNIYRYPPVDSLFRICPARSSTGWKSERYKRLKFVNTNYLVQPWNKEKLRAGNLYTYWISAWKGFENLGSSSKISIYYFESSKGTIKREIKQREFSISIANYREIISEQTGVQNSLAGRGFRRHVWNFTENEEEIRFRVSYIELQPYKILISGNDGYLRIGEVVRAFLPAKYGVDHDLLALMLILNYQPDSDNPVIDRSRIMVEEPIKIPISSEMLKSD